MVPLRVKSAFLLDEHGLFFLKIVKWVVEIHACVAEDGILTIAEFPYLNEAVSALAYLIQGRRSETGSNNTNGKWVETPE